MDNQREQDEDRGSVERSPDSSESNDSDRRDLSVHLQLEGADYHGVADFDMYITLNPDLEWDELYRLVMQARLHHDPIGLSVLSGGDFDGDIAYPMVGSEAQSTQNRFLSGGDFDGDIGIIVAQSDGDDIVDALSVLSLQHGDVD
ncbi:hypothetical protein VNI00_015646 [Paramarasmius palmivorus]|uniref:Uncharacterized protein n=1 Tax=Paramarasmius palmivorus TaxID=297713 RepID=A0AAW0BJR4_9AGAR